jgi:hypothetical protein
MLHQIFLSATDCTPDFSINFKIVRLWSAANAPASRLHRLMLPQQRRVDFGSHPKWFDHIAQSVWRWVVAVSLNAELGIIVLVRASNRQFMVVPSPTIADIGGDGYGFCLRFLRASRDLHRTMRKKSGNGRNAIRSAYLSWYPASNVFSSS